MRLTIPQSVAAIVLALVIVADASARQPYLAIWDGLYPDSTSDDASCQMCHSSAAGGQPWNSYGWDIKEEFVLNGGNIGNAIEVNFVEFEDSDADPEDTTNLSEIHLNHQPGWTEGANNTVYFCTGCLTPSSLNNVVPMSGQSPPALPAGIEIDPPVINIPLGDTIALEDIDDGSDAPNFVAPNYATAAPGIDGFLFVVDQIGKIWKVDLSDGSKTDILNVSDDEPSGSKICDLFTGYDERGLLGLAFHPQFATNGLFYTYQSEEVAGNENCAVTFGTSVTPNHKSVVAEWQAINPGTSDFTVSEDSKRVVLEIDQPQFNHNGGMMAFSPVDNYLYISVGDGGNRDDQGPGHSVGGNGQDDSNLLGAILRIDPLGGAPYSIPSGNDPDNVFDADEIFANGFRNVWRFSFDSTGNLYAGDVGQGDIEEVNLVEIGKNYGWNEKEGSFFFYENGGENGYISNTPPADATTGLIDPILQYDHDEGVSVIGGYVYEGSTLSGLNSAYLFGEYSKPIKPNEPQEPSGRLFYSSDLSTFQEFRIQGQSDLGFLLMGFGRDSNGELYVMGRPNNILSTDPSNELGVLKKLVPAQVIPPSSDDDVCFPIVGANGNTAVVCL